MVTLPACVPDSQLPTFMLALAPVSKFSCFPLTLQLNLPSASLLENILSNNNSGISIGTWKYALYH